MNIKTMLVNRLNMNFHKKGEKHTIASINKKIAELEAERKRLEDIQINTTEMKKRELLQEFHRLSIDESQFYGFWAFNMYEYTEDEDEDYYMDEPLLSINGENCYKCGGYLDVCKSSDIDENGYDRHGAYRKYADNIRCKCGDYVHWLPHVSGTPDPRKF